jgi:hypothetical protein
VDSYWLYYVFPALKSIPLFLLLPIHDALNSCVRLSIYLIKYVHWRVRCFLEYKNC